MDHGACFDSGSATHHLTLQHALSVCDSNLEKFRQSNSSIQLISVQKATRRDHKVAAVSSLLPPFHTFSTYFYLRYRASSGALVFGAGTVQWSWGLDNFHDAVTGMNNMWESEYLGVVQRGEVGWKLVVSG